MVQVPTAWIQQRQNCNVIAEDAVPLPAYIFEVSTDFNGYSDTLQAPRTISHLFLNRSHRCNQRIALEDLKAELIKQAGLLFRQ